MGWNLKCAKRCERTDKVLEMRKVVEWSNKQQHILHNIDKNGNLFYCVHPIDTPFQDWYFEIESEVLSFGQKNAEFFLEFSILNFLNFKTLKTKNCPN